MARSRFLRDQGGAVALLFGILLIPILGMAGAALDYSRAANAKTQLQSALDATALAVARDGREMNDAELTAFARDYLAANYAGNFYYDYQLESVTREGSSVILTGTGNVPTTIFALLGVHDMPVSTRSEVNWRTEKVEIALALDNTGSMSRQGRMQRLKEATRILLDTLEAQVIDPDDVRISIIPFDMHVKVDTQYEDAEWLSPIDERGPGQQGRGGGEAVGQGARATEWMGCIEDRNHPHDWTPGPVTAEQERYPAVECDSNSLQAIQPLTENFSVLRQIVDAMTPAGWTNITIGLMWGLNTLAPYEPFTGGVAFGTEDVRKILILMTDGQNTKNRWNESTGQINVRTRMACDSVKATGVMLYTVRFMEGDQSLLRNCATSPDMFYNVERLDQLRPAFEAIAAQISKIRLTR